MLVVHLRGGHGISPAKRLFTSSLLLFTSHLSYVVVINNISMIDVLTGSEFVMNRAQSVRIDHERLAQIAAQYKSVESKHWLLEAPFNLQQLSEPEIVNFLLLFYALIFCFWGEPKWTVDYQDQKYDGSFGLLIALRKAYENGIPILDWAYWQGISQEEFSSVLRGNVIIPLFDERLAIVHEVGRILMAKYQGQAAQLIQSCGKDARKLLECLSSDFPSFRDTAHYDDQEIAFYKRAQLFVVDVYHFFAGKGLGDLSHIDSITALADYKVPQILRHLGILVYAEDLAHLVDTKQEIAHDSQPEIEIRVANIWAVELMRRIVSQKLPMVTSTEINDYFWLQSQTAQNMRPYHRSRTIFY